MLTISDVIEPISSNYPCVDWATKRFKKPLETCNKFQVLTSFKHEHTFIVVTYTNDIWTNDLIVTEFIANTKANREVLTEVCEKLNQLLAAYKVCLL